MVSRKSGSSSTMQTVMGMIFSVAAPPRLLQSDKRMSPLSQRHHKAHFRAAARTVLELELPMDRGQSFAQVDQTMSGAPGLVRLLCIGNSAPVIRDGYFQLPGRR